MMKKLFIFAAIFIMALSVNAQTFTEDESSQFNEEFGNGLVRDKRQNVLSFGVKAGANLSTLSKYGEADLGLKSGVGFEGGAIVAARFGKRTLGSPAGTGLFGVQIEPSYVQHTIGTNEDDIKLSYFEIPVLLKLFLTPNFNVEIGPNFAGTLSSSPDYIEADNTSIATGEIKGFDVKVCVGVSYEMKNGLFASLRYQLGTSGLAKNFDSRVSAASLTIGYKFNVFKF